MTPLTITTGTEATYTVVFLAGELDLDSRTALETTLAGLLAEGRRDILVDLGGLAFCDCAGLGSLITAGQRFALAGGSLRWRHPSGMVARVLTLCGLDSSPARPVR